MDQLITNFHFVRPLWLLGCVPALLLFISLWFIRSRSSGWNRAIDQALLPHLLDSNLGKRQNWPLFMVLLAWFLSCVSLAGPVWEKLPQPIQKKEDALVIIQDLSLSFYAQDLSPNRLERAQHKLADILKQRNEGTTALVVYSGDAHIVSPLTDDSNTIAAMIDSLSPGIMPSYGSDVTEAVQVSLRLLKDAGMSRGRILLLTDEVEKNDAQEVSKLLQGKNVIFHVLGVGTSDGGPIPKNDGGFLKDTTGNIIVPRLNRNVLKELASDNNGRYSDIQLDDRDIEYLLAAESFTPHKDEYRQLDREFDQWNEMGHWLLLLILPVALLAFRKGWLLVFIVTICMGSSESYAFTWQDLWERKDQQAANALNENNPEKAAELFQSQSWKGVAEYKANNFSSAVESFGQNETADSYYNRGNALAKAGNSEEAVKSYDKALQLNPDMEDARFNKNLLEQLMQQQQQNDKQSQDSGDQEQQQENQQDQSEQEEQNEQNQQDQGEQEQNQKDPTSNQDQASQQKDQKSQTADQQKKDQENADSSQEEQQGKKAEQRDSEQKQKEDVANEVRKSAAENQQSDKAMQAAEGDMTAEEKQALEQWLRQVPDNPGGLLQRKFEYESRQNQRQRNHQNSKIW